MSYLKNISIALFMFSTVLLSIFTAGCVDGKSKKDEEATQPPSVPPPNFTLQMILDEAAKGEDADFPQLQYMFDKVVVNTAKADELAKMKKGKGSFFCLVLELPQNLEVSSVVKGFLQNVSVDVLQDDCDASKKPFELVIDPARSVKGDQVAQRDVIINSIVEKADPVVFAALSDGPRVTLVLDAVKSDDTNLSKTIKAAGGKNDVIDWALRNKAHAKVMPALRGAGIITEAMVLAEVASTNSAKFRFLYETAITDTAAADRLAILAGGAPEFSAQLAAKPANADNFEVWQTHLGLVTNKNAEVSRPNAAGTMALNVMVDNTRAMADDTHLFMVVALMARHASPATIGAVAGADLEGLYSSVSSGGNQAELQRMFTETAVGANNAMLAWVLVHKADIVNGGGTVSAAFTNSVRIDNRLDHTHVLAAVGGGNNALLHFLYDVVISNGAKADILAAHGAAPHFINQLAAIAADAHTLAVMGKHLGWVTNPDLELEKPNGAGTTAFNLMVAAGGRPAGDVNRAEMVELMTRHAQPATIAAVVAADLPVLYEAVATHGDRAELQRMFTQTAPASNTPMLAWVIGHKADAINGGGTVNDAFTDSVRTDGRLDYTHVLSAVTGNSAELRFLYDAAIPDLAAADTLAAHGAVPQFANQLAAVAADSDRFEVFSKHLGLVTNANAELLKVNGAGITAFKLMIDSARAIPAINDTHRTQVVELMARHAQPATIAAVVALDLPLLYDAARTIGKQALMVKVLQNTGPNAPEQTALADWTYTNRNQQIVNDGAAPTIIATLQATPGIITQAMLIAEARKAATNNSAQVRFFYELAIVQDNHATTLAGDPAKFSYHLSKKVVDADTIVVWRDYFKKLEADGGAGVPASTRQINLAPNTPIKELLKPRAGVGDVPVNWEELVATMVKKGNPQSVRQANTEDLLVRMLNATLNAGKAADLDKILVNVDDAHVKWVGTWVGAHLDAASKDGVGLGNIFQPAYNARGLQPRKDLNDSLITAAYDTGKKSAGRKGTAVSPWQRVDYENAVAEVAKVVTNRFLLPQIIVGKLFKPFNLTDRARLLYVVLAHVEQELKLDVNFALNSADKYFSGPMVNSLSAPIKGLFTAAAGNILQPYDEMGAPQAPISWRGYLDASDNKGGVMMGLFPPAAAIEKDLVRNNVTSAYGNGVILFGGPGMPATEEALVKSGTWLDY